MQEQLDTLWQKALPYFKEYVNTESVSQDFMSTKEDIISDNQKQAFLMNRVNDYVQSINLPANITIDVDPTGHRSPFMIIDLTIGSEPDLKTIGFYTHIDKQPPMDEKWSEGLGPYSFTEKNGKYYGRGVADDGYAIYLIINMMKLLYQNNVKNRYVLLIEASEESGSPDLPHYLAKHSSVIESLTHLFICDTGGGSDTIYFTSSLRGCMIGSFTCKTARAPVHSGTAGGLLPSAPVQMVSVLSEFMDFEDEHLRLLCVDPPSHIQKQYHNVSNSSEASKILDVELGQIGQLLNESESNYVRILDAVWNPTFAIVGMDGFPTVEKGGNLVLSEITAKLSFRIPPTIDDSEAARIVQNALTQERKYCKTSYTPIQSCNGWISGDAGDEFNTTLEKVSHDVYGKSPAYVPCGASIPVMGMLQKSMPNCCIFATGVNGNECNSHSFDENLDIEKLRKFSLCFYNLIASM
jgi:acetylornithine deacetylase/succinyl-diaminopimelate desuccinylase-like protein